MKVPIKYLLITVLFHATILIFLWYYTLDNSFLNQKKTLLIELFGLENKPYGTSSLGSQVSSADNLKQIKSEQKKYFLASKDDPPVSHSIDSLQDTSSIVMKPVGDAGSLNTDDTSGGALFAYGSGQLTELPSFAGGGINKFREWMIYNIRLSSITGQKRISGTILIIFIVDIDGEVTNITVQKGISPEIDNEAIRIIKSSPRWTPGRQQGQPVRIIYKLPLTFSM